MTFSQKMWFGEVERLSGSENAIIAGESVRRVDGTKSQLDNEVNLGPLPRKIVGEEVRFAYGGGTYGLCLDIEYIDGEYLDYMAGRPSLDSTEIELSHLLLDADIPETVNPGDILLAEHYFSLPEHGMYSNIPDGRYLAEIGPKTDEEWSCLGVVEEPIIQSEIPVPVMVTEVHSTYLETKGAVPEIEDEVPDIGETITAITGPQTELGTLALYETDYAIPVLLENAQYPSEESIKIQITSIDGVHAIGEAVFSADNFDSIHVSDDKVPRRKRRSQTRVIEESAPIDIKPVPEEAPTTTKVIVTDEGEDALVGRWGIREEIGSVEITKGDEITLRIRLVDGESCVGYYKQFPVHVNFDRTVPEEFADENLAVSVQTVHPDKAIAEPIWVTEAQEELEVRVVGSTAGEAIALREGHPIRIPNASVVTPNDRVLVGLSESTDSDVATGTVSARPVFQNTDGPYLIRLPQIRGDVVQAGGTPAVVDHLPDVDTAVTLGVAEVNEDHIVPTVTSLPEAHLPDEGAYISAESEAMSDNMIVGVGEELPLKLPPFLTAQTVTITARVLERRPESLFGVFGSVGDDTSELLLQVYEHLQLAGLALKRREYRDAAGHLSEAHQFCPSEFSVLERLLAVHETTIQTILAIRNDADFTRTASTLSQEANQLCEFKDSEEHTAGVVTFLSAREAEVRAAKQLLAALDKVDRDTTSDLQAIAQGVSAKAPVVKAAEHLSTAEELGTRTPFEEQIPSPGLRSVIWEFNQAFPSVVDELPPFDQPEEDVDWFRYLLPEGILERTDERPPSPETDGNTWQRPAVPETMGIIPVTDIAINDDASIKAATQTRKESTPEESPSTEESDGLNIATSESRQTEGNRLQDSANDKESPATEPGPSPTGTEDEAPEKASTTGSDSNEPSTKTATGNQTLSTKNTSEGETETTPEVNTTSNTTKSETSKSKIPDEPLSVPDNSPKLRKLRKKAEAEASENPEREHVETTTSRYRRSSAVREYALERADGTCELCGEKAPFVKPDGNPFLEVHHVDELGEGGADHPSLVGAVCPNCHKEIHHGKRGEDLNELLRKRLEKGLADVGAVSE